MSLTPGPGFVHFCYPTDNETGAECEREKEEDGSQQKDGVPQLVYHWTISFLRLDSRGLERKGVTTNLVQTVLTAQEGSPWQTALRKVACALDCHDHPFYVAENMKFALVIGLLLISTIPVAEGQQSRKHASLTRAGIREAEQRLSDLGYWTGTIDGRMDPATRSALIAFQKWQGRPLTGQLTADELDAIRISEAPGARELGYAHVEVDLDRQVLLLVGDNDGVRVLPISSGGGEPFVDDGQTSIAYTPRGRFLVYDKEIGWGHGPLGSVYYANFISGGVAIHGSPSVPVQPASHGCIRIPVFAAREVSKLLTVGTIVLVYDKVSFVSAKPWVENPLLKQAALSNASKEHIDYVAVTKPTSKSAANKRARSRLIRAGLQRIRFQGLECQIGLQLNRQSTITNHTP